MLERIQDGGQVRVGDVTLSQERTWSTGMDQVAGCITGCEVANRSDSSSVTFFSLTGQFCEDTNNEWHHTVDTCHALLALADTKLNGLTP